MLVVGERINSTNEAIAKAIAAQDGAFIQAQARLQAEAGAAMLDVNCGTLVEGEPEALEWLVRTVQAAVPVPLCIDSPNAEAVARALRDHQGQALVNSVTLEKARFANLVPLVIEHQALVVALCMGENGIPNSVDGALATGERLVTDLVGAGIPLENIYFDPLVRSVGTNPEAVPQVLEVIAKMRQRFPGLHCIVGLSNVSHGLPGRQHLNRAFLVLAMSRGLDAAIMDPTDQAAMALVYAAQGLLGSDRRCLRYIRMYRQGKLGVA